VLSGIRLQRNWVAGEHGISVGDEPSASYIYAIIYAGLAVKRPLVHTRPRRPTSWYSEPPAKGGWISRTFNNRRVVLGYEEFRVLH
jgi:hypothetical protein